MRTADDSQRSDDGDDAAPLGGGYSASVQPGDLTDGYGDGFDDDQVEASTSETDETIEDLGLDEESIAHLDENEAEDVLVDIVESEGFTPSEAEGIVDDLEADTGLSATELLEDLVEFYDEPDASDGSLGVDGSGLAETDTLLAGEPFDPLDLPSESDLDVDHDGEVTSADVHQAHHAFDFDIDG